MRGVFHILMSVISVFVMGTAFAQQRTEVFVSKDPKGVHYRIPALAALPDGGLICVADGGKPESFDSLVFDGGTPFTTDELNVDGGMP